MVSQDLQCLVQVQQHSPLKLNSTCHCRIWVIFYCCRQEFR
jgi:hypothetical protein